MDFMINHLAFTFSFCCCFIGTIIFSVSPYTAEKVFMVNGRSFNLGTLGLSVFVQGGWISFIINMIFSAPGLFFCEHYYGSEITLLAIVASGIYQGILGIVFDKESLGFSGTGVALTVMACFYGFHWYGIILGIIVIISACTLDMEAAVTNTHFLSAIAALFLVFSYGKTTGTLESPAVKVYEAPDEITFSVPIISSYRMTSDYGYRKDPFYGTESFHKGIDMACPEGTGVYSSAYGTVEATGYDNTYGNYIVIKHGDGYSTKYAHLSKVSVSRGNQVEQGGYIGAVGSTGYSTGSHLHFMVMKNGKPINPRKVLAD